MEYSHTYKQVMNVWSPDSKFIAGVNLNRVLIRDSVTLSVVGLFNCHDKIDKILWSPNSAYILSVVQRKSCVQLYNVLQQKVIGPIEETTLGLSSALWSPDSKHVLTVSEFQIRLCVWNINGADVVATIRRPKHHTRGISFSDSRQYLSVAVTKDNVDVVNVYSVPEGYKLIQRLAVKTSDLRDIRWCRNTHIIVWDTHSEYRLLVYSVKGSLVKYLEAYTDGLGIRSVDLNSSHSLIAIAGYDNKIRLIETNDWTELPALAHTRRLKGGIIDTEVYREDVVTASATARILHYFSSPPPTGSFVRYSSVSILAVQYPSRVRNGCSGFSSNSCSSVGSETSSDSKYYLEGCINWHNSNADTSNNNNNSENNKNHMNTYYVNANTNSNNSCSDITFSSCGREGEAMQCSLSRYNDASFVSSASFFVKPKSVGVRRSVSVPSAGDSSQTSSSRHTQGLVSKQMWVRNRKDSIRRKGQGDQTHQGQKEIDGVENVHAGQFVKEFRVPTITVENCLCPRGVSSITVPPCSFQSPSTTPGLVSEGLISFGISKFSWSADGFYIASLNDSQPTVLWVWDIYTFSVRALLTHRSSVLNFCWSVDPATANSVLTIVTGESRLFQWQASCACVIEVDAGRIMCCKVECNSCGNKFLIQDKIQMCVASKVNLSPNPSQPEISKDTSMRTATGG